MLCCLSSTVGILMANWQEDWPNTDVLLDAGSKTWPMRLCRLLELHVLTLTTEIR